MKRVILSQFFVVLAWSAFSQKSFIGQTKQQVRAFWETKVSVEFIEEDVWSDTGQEYISIDASSVGTPAFTATFDKAGKCIEQSSEISAQDVSVFQAKFKKQGFTYDKVKDHWKKPGTAYVWQIKTGAGNKHSLECRKI